MQAGPAVMLGRRAASDGLAPGTDIANELLWRTGRDDHGALGKLQNNGPVRVRYKCAMSSQFPAPEKACEGKDPAVSERPDAPSHHIRLKLCRPQASQWQARRPEQATNQKRVVSDGVAADGKERPGANDRKWKQCQPAESPRTAANHPNRDANTQDGHQRRADDERFAPRCLVAFQMESFAV